MAETQQKLQAFSDQYQKLQQDLQGLISSRQKLEAQQKENEDVQKEFGDLKEDANIYKLMGPVLLKQDKTEAVMAVDGRLEYIRGEIQRIEKQISDLQQQCEQVKTEIIQIQSTAAGPPPAQVAT